MPVQDSSLLPPPHFNVDRRKSLDVNCYRLVQHPYAAVVREKNEALLAKSPLSPPGSTQALTRPPSTMGPIRSASLLSPYAHPPRSYRASEPHVFTPLRGAPFLGVPDSNSVCTTSSSVPPHFVPRRSYENRPFAFASRAAPPPIPGPLPRPDFQFGESSSTSPSQNASPEGDTPPGSSSGSSAQASSPDISISMLHRWSFPRGSTTSITSATSPNGIPPHCSLREGDGDAEDAISTTPSSSIGCLSRFGSVASITGSESSVMFSDVSSCVAVDMGGDSSVRRGSCGSGQLLEMRMSGLNVNSHQNPGDFSARPLPPGYASSSSTMSPGDRQQTKESSPASCPPLSRSGSMYEFSGVPPNEIPLVRRGSMPPAVHAPPVTIPEQHIHPHPHGHSMYMQNTGTESKYSIQWASGSGDYVTQPHQHFSPQDTHSFGSDTPTTGTTNGAYPQSLHHQQPVSHQPRHHTQAPTDLTYSSTYHLRESVASDASTMGGIHSMATSNGFVIGGMGTLSGLSRFGLEPRTCIPLFPSSHLPHHSHPI
ncbi:hypothetical protein M404DRAFT_213610 [Pisolithus tinctorius Marx 270]|uniref:Uncharacterized protein n=1 Tax=Pisolithus tinctorius Marx 270 TaxID=870435 RepID=A0A0C3P8Q7_PISTI|nr:hypothetical protein M404DRAFT_213610 [Pisolithus tinctorius Marx 270]